MIRSALCNLIGGRINMTDAATLAKLGEWAERWHDELSDSELWKDLLNIYTIAVSAGQSEVILRHQVQRFLGARYDTQNLMPVDQVFLLITDPDIWDRTGTPTRVADLPSMGTYVKPTSEQIALVSSNAADTAKSVTLVGELAGVEMREVLTLNGTTPVLSANSYDIVYTLAKELTVGDVTVTGNTTAAALVTLLRDEYERKHLRLRLLETPVQALTLMVLGKRKPTPYRVASDAPAVRCLSHALEFLTHGDALDWLEQKSDAEKMWGKGLAFLEKAKEKEVFQSANIQQLVPYDGHGYGPELTGKGYL